MRRQTPTKPAAPKPGRRRPTNTRKHTPGVSQLSQEQRDLALSLMRSDHPPPDTEIARRLGCSYYAIRHLRDKATEKGDVAKRVLKVYARRFVRELPPNERVTVYSAIARGDIDAKRAFSALKALQRIEELEGIVTRKEQKEAEAAKEVAAPTALFVVSGASIQIQAPQPVVVEAESARSLPPAAEADAVESTT